jgi:hypothetical protein
MHVQDLFRHVNAVCGLSAELRSQETIWHVDGAWEVNILQ